MLKQTSNETKILFLKLFAKELIFNSKPKAKEIEKPTEKIGGKKFAEISEAVKPIEIKKESIEKEKLIPSILKIEPSKSIESLSAPISEKKPATPLRLTGPLRPITKPLESLRKHSLTTQTFIEPLKFTMPISSLPKIEEKVSLDKLNMFLFDAAVTEIECPGPDKFIFVRKASQVNLTKISLSQEEITKIIESFSEKARIPVISGVFKASVGNLTITAIISEFVGSRFIIYKSSPYSIIDQQIR